MAAWTARVVDRSGAVLANLPSTTRIAPIRRALNQPSSGGITMHNLDPGAAAVVALDREVQYRRDGVLVDWQVPTSPESIIDGEAGVDEATIGTQGILWYFGRRFFGKADRTNYLANPEAEADLTGWTATGATATADTTRRLTGTKAFKLIQAAAGVDTYLGQGVDIAGGGVGALVTLAGWFYIDTAGWVGPAIENRGLFLQRRTGATVHEFTFALIDNDTPRGVWLRGETTVHVPAGVTQTVDTRLYAPGTTGGIWFDSLSLTVMESLSYYATDQAIIAGAIVAHAQDGAYGKSDLNIGWSVPATGVLRDRHYQFAEHQEIFAALSEFPALSDGFDFDVALTDITRTFTSYYPRKGISRPAVTLAELSRARWLFDGHAAASSMTLLGEGDGPDREEGSAVDATVFGGTTYEAVEAAPTGTPIDALDARATEALRPRKNPRVLETTFAPGARMGALDPGDTATITIDHGFMQVSGTWRAIATTHHPDSDQLSAEWNPA